MSLRYEAITTPDSLKILRHCYKYVQDGWQHIPREDLPDSGFEIAFRQSCKIELKDSRVSQEWELGFGSELTTASGVRHEIDLVVEHADGLVVLELKNKPKSPPGKNDVIIFFAKILDYLVHNPRVLLNEIVPVFVSSCTFEEPTLATCLGLGIHPVSPGLRPVPDLARNLQLIENEIARGIVLPNETAERWEDMCARFNSLHLELSSSWLDSKCGYVSDELINFRATNDIDSLKLSRELRQINGDCSEVLRVVKWLANNAVKGFAVD